MQTLITNQTLMQHSLPFPIDGQNEVTNKTLGAIIRTLVQKNTRDWDEKLCHAKFAYNQSLSLTTKYSPFESVDPLLITLLDLLVQDRLHKEALEHAAALPVQLKNNIISVMKRGSARHLKY